MTKQWTPEQILFMSERLSQIKCAVLRAVVLNEPIAIKPVPLNIQSFGELHDYCDANELGGFCDDALQPEMERLFPERTDADTLFTQEWMEAANDVQTMANAWIQSGSMRRNASRLACLDREQVECFLDPDRVSEARGMIDDLFARVLGRVPNFSAEDLEVLDYIHRTVLFPHIADEETAE